MYQNIGIAFLVLATGAGRIRVDETRDRPSIKIKAGNVQSVRSLRELFSGGKMGWSFDLTRSCKLAITSAALDGGWELEVSNLDAEGRETSPRILAVSGVGLSS